MNKTFTGIAKEQFPPHILAAIAFVVIVAGAYGVWTNETYGTISLSAPVFGTDVYVDGKFERTLRNPGEIFEASYPEGKHTVIVSRGGYSPWKGDVSLSPKKTVSLSPFLAPSEIRAGRVGETIVVSDGTTAANPEYLAAVKTLSGASISPDVLALVKKTGIQGAVSADYYPGRKDVIIVSAKDGVYAVDASYDSPRNFQPLYKSTSFAAPIFARNSENGFFYVKDGEAVYRISGLSQ